MDKKEKNIIRKRLIRSYVTSGISISLVLTLVAAAAVFGANARSIGRYFKENMSVSVILKQSVTENAAMDLTQTLTREPFVKSARYISKEEGTEEMQALLGDDFLDVFETSPIPISIDLHLDGNALTSDSLEVIKSKILALKEVEEVSYQEHLVEALNSNLETISLVIAVVVALLLVISFALISNTVRLNIYARRFTIHTMSLVGAKRSFIARPFVKHAVVQGTVAGALALITILCTLAYANSKSQLLSSMMDSGITATVLGGTFLLGIFICVISTMIVVGKVAYITKDNLYY